MAFDDELQFESEHINLLFEKGWEREVIKYPTEETKIEVCDMIKVEMRKM